VSTTTYQKNGQNLGYNASITFTPSNGGAAFSADDIGWLMKFSAKQNQKLHETIPMSGNGQPINDITYHGWSGDMSFTRFNGNITKIFQNLEQNQYNGGAPVKFSIQVQTSNPDGSVDTDVYADCVIWGDGGDYAADKPVDQKLNFAASQCTKTSGGSSGVLNL
jgi:hypothetical protein